MEKLGILVGIRCRSGSGYAAADRSYGQHYVGRHAIWCLNMEAKMQELNLIEIEKVAGGRPMWMYAIEAFFEFSQGFYEGVRDTMPR